MDREYTVDGFAAVASEYRAANDALRGALEAVDMHRESHEADSANLTG